MFRLPLLPKDALNEAQLRLHENLVGGKRAKVPRKFPLENEDGSLNGPFNVLLYKPELGDLVQKLGNLLRFESDLSGPLREAAILTVAQHWRSDYEWFAHSIIAEKEGVSTEAIAAIKDGQAPGDEELALVHRLVSEFLRNARVSDATYDAAAARFGEGATVELTILVGYYCIISGVLNVFEVDMPPGEEPPFGK
jgi:4-carboxymuconolactone decarboxylase